MKRILNISSFIALLFSMGFFQHDELLKGFVMLALSLSILLITFKEY